MVNDMQEKFLPIGSVVLLKNADKKVMITALCSIALDKKEIYDYSAVIYPEGVIDNKDTLLFNHDQIKEIYSVGYMDEDCSKYLEYIKIINEKLREQIKNNLFDFSKNINDIEIL